MKLRAPAVPLLLADPQFSVWSFGDALYDDFTMHWSGQRQSVTGLVRIDGKAYRFMGKKDPHNRGLFNNLEPAGLTQTDVRVEPTSSIYTFEGAGIRLTVTFFSPLMLDDLRDVSSPVSYITCAVAPLDGATHRVEIYLDVSAELCVDSDDCDVVGAQGETDRVIWLNLGNAAQKPLGKSGDMCRLGWGHVYLATEKASPIRLVSGMASLRDEFAQCGTVENGWDGTSHPLLPDFPVMAAVLPLGEITEEAALTVAVAYDDGQSVLYFGQPLKGMWTAFYDSFIAMLEARVMAFSAIRDRAVAFDRALCAEAERVGGKPYADMCALAYRQTVGAHKAVRSPEGDLLFFSKECGSNGCIGTLDVTYPSVPLFLLYNTDYVKGMLRPLLVYAQSAAWPFDFAPHDVGVYPLANGQVYGLKPDGTFDSDLHMPVEESGNALILAAVISQLDGNTDFIRPYWNLLSRWVRYLVEMGVDPDKQLCTDDFAGRQAHNVNLSIKAILGIRSYAYLCGKLGYTDEAVHYETLSRALAAEWEEKAADGDHYRLAFDLPGSWSLKYNLVWDQFLNFAVFDPAIAETEFAYYQTVMNRYGVPLDNRAAHTKADWYVYTGCFAKTRKEFEAYIRPLWDFLNDTPSRVPFTDWYGTTDRLMQLFQNRTVLGGLYIRILQERLLKNSRDNTADTT